MAYISKFKGSEIDSILTDVRNSIKPGLSKSIIDINKIEEELTELSTKIENISINSIPIVKSKDELGKLDVPLGSIGSIVSEEYTFEVSPYRVEPGTIIKGIKLTSEPIYGDFSSYPWVSLGFTNGSLGSSVSIQTPTSFLLIITFNTIEFGVGILAQYNTSSGKVTLSEDNIAIFNKYLQDNEIEFRGCTYGNGGDVDFADLAVTLVAESPSNTIAYIKTSKGIDEPTPRKFSDFGTQPELFPKEERIVKNFEFLNSTVSGGGIIVFETIGGSIIRLKLTYGSDESGSDASWFIIYNDGDEKPLTEEELQKFKELVNSTTVYYTNVLGPQQFKNAVDTLVSADFPLPLLKELKTWTPIAVPISSDDIDSIFNEVFGGGYYYYSDDGIGSWDDYAYEADGIGEFEETNVEELNVESDETGS